MRLFIAHRVDASTPELAAEQFLIELHDDGTGTVATRPSDDRSIAWSPPVLMFTEVRGR